MHTSIVHEGERDNDASSSHAEEEGSIPIAGATSRQDKDAAGSKAKGKAKLAFEVTQSKDHDRLWDRTVVEEKDAQEHDGEYSIDDLGPDTPMYDLDVLLGNQSPLSTGKPTLPTKPRSTVLLGEGYVPITGFQANPAFNSIRGDATRRGSAQSSDHPWCRGSTTDAPQPRNRSPVRVTTPPPLPPPVAENVPVPPS